MADEERAAEDGDVAESAQTDTTSQNAAGLGSSVAFRAGGRRDDGSVEISVADDLMSATASFYPPLGDGLPLDQGYVRELIERLGIQEGILWDEIVEAVLSCNLDRKIIRDKVIARGKQPVEEVPEHAELEEKFRKRIPLVSSDAARVDYKSISSFVVVRKGEVLARILPRVEGQPGLDLAGKTTPAPRKSVETYSAGKNVKRTSEALESLVEGLLSQNGNRLDVEEVLLVKGAVDYHTGHIVFPGDVLIDGGIGDGFKVYSGGSIVCKATMDAYDVSAKKDLICAQGIIGRRRAQIRVGGELRAKFIQNCKAAVRGNILLGAAAVASSLYTLGFIDLGDKGVLMGGEAFAVHGLRAGKLGNQAHQRTVVHVGIDFTVQRSLDAANEKLRLLSLRAQQADVLGQAHPGAKAERVKAELEKAVTETRNEISRLLEKLDADDRAVVEVRGEIYPGTVIDICRISIVVDELLKACRFRLDKTAGRILVERLGGGEGGPRQGKRNAETEAEIQEPH